MFSDHLALRPHSLANFVGGGGKTVLVLKLMEEYCAEGPVLYTTTTRIHPPDANEGLSLISSDNLQLLKLIVDKIGRCYANRPAKLAVTRHYISPTLLRGVPPDFDNGLERSLFPMLLNEADGAAGFSIKMPRENEPVLMENAEYLIPVIGIDCLYKPLGPDAIFRWKEFSGRALLNEGDVITPGLAADLLMHPQGVCRGWRAGMEIIPFINKVDEPVQNSPAVELANSILSNHNFPVRRVVCGSVHNGTAFTITAEQTNVYCAADEQQ